MTAPPSLDAYARTYLADARDVLDDGYLLEGARRIVPMLLRARAERKVVFLLGNGGSASAASHFVTDLSKVATRPPAPPIRCIGLADNVPGLTALANDVDYAHVFSEQLRTLASPGDVVIAISGSGNSPNVLEAVTLARTLGLATIGLTGMGGGKLKDLVEVPVVVPSKSMQHTEDAHVTLLHLLTAYLRDAAPATER
jgi:D-sedoheptulose 7-phosphate isomerase